MATRAHLELLNQGLSVWNQWREQNWNMQPDLSGASLSRVDLTGADLSRANLTEALQPHLWRETRP